MDISVTLKNYRCFSERPVTFTLNQGTTAFLGPNNIGKSAICKLFYGLSPVFQKISTFPQFHNWLKSRDISQARNGMESFQSAGMDDLRRWACRFSTGDCDLKLEIPNVGGIQLLMNLRESKCAHVSAWCFDPALTITMRQTGPHEVELTTLRGEREHKSVNTDPPDDTSNVIFQRIQPLIECLARVRYVPAGRHMLYAQGEQPFDLRVGDSLFSEWRTATQSTDPDTSRKARKLIERLGEIFSDRRLDIRTEQQGRTLLVTYLGEDYTIGELGNGIGQFVEIGISSLTAAPSILFIDEPETGLHPSLQEALIDFLVERTSHGVVFTTHSVGLARATSDNIFSLVPHGDGHPDISTFESISNLIQFLGEMSFSSYHELGYSRLLFVEGNSEIGPIRHWLRELRVDHKVMVMPLAGSAGISLIPREIEELKRICNDIWILVDSEKANADAELDTTRRLAIEACEHANVPMHVLERRSLENYFPSKAVKLVKGKQFDELSSFERTWTGHSKIQMNLLMAEQTRLDEVLSPDLPAFLRRVASFGAA